MNEMMEPGDLVSRLRALSRYEHDDLSIGDEAAEEIERLRELCREVYAKKWQPIEKAPRNGEIILFWSRDGGFFVGNWPPGCSAGNWSKLGSDWRGQSDWRANAATHWMPLPKAPNADVTGA